MTAPPLLLALHSCSDCFGMALLDPQQPGAEPLVQVIRMAGACPTA